MKKLSQAKIIAFKRKIELLKAREQKEFDNYSDAEQKYENIVRIEKSSAKLVQLSKAKIIILLAIIMSFVSDSEF